MDKEETKKAIDNLLHWSHSLVKSITVMKAYVDGAKIEARPINTSAPWLILNDPEWDWSSMEYRVSKKR